MSDPLIDALTFSSPDINVPVNESSDTVACISQLFIYPVKSCAGVQVTHAILTETGLEFDRAWMVVDAAGRFLTQRELPRMALIKPQLRYYDLILRAPGMLALYIELDRVEESVQVEIWNEKVQAYDMGGVAAQWFTDFLGLTARLVRFDPEHKRVSDSKWTGDVQALNQFSDGYSVLVLSEASLAQFNEKRISSGAKPVAMERFRPNVVLGDVVECAGLSPHDEDRLELLQITTLQGVARLKLVKPCPRCPIPNVDPITAISNPDIGDLLQSYRKDARLGGAVTFGMNAIVLQGVDCQLQVGQTVAADFRFD